MQPSSELTPSSVLISFVRLLEEHHIENCVVGRTDGLPDRIEGDVDIIVEDSALHRLGSMLAALQKSTGVRLVQCFQHEANARHFIVAWPGSDNLPRYFGPDMCGDYHRNGRHLLGAREILRDRRPATYEDGREKGFSVPAPADAFIYYLVKRIDKLHIDDIHAQFLSKLAGQDPAGARKWVERFWCPPSSELIARSALEGDWAPVCAELKFLQRELRHGRPASWATTRREWVRRLTRLRHPTGLHVAVMGPDGSGKSGALEAMAEQLGPMFRRTSLHHFRPHWGRASFSIDSPANAPHDQIARPWLASAAKIFYYAADYLFGYLRHIYPSLARSTLVLYDRYYDDLLVDPVRYRYGGPRHLPALLRRLIPRPDLTFILLASPDSLRARKGEISDDEAGRQFIAYRNLADRDTRTSSIDADRDFNTVTAEICAGVLAHMEARAARRLRP